MCTFNLSFLNIPKPRRWSILFVMHNTSKYYYISRKKKVYAYKYTKKNITLPSFNYSHITVFCIISSIDVVLKFNMETNIW